MSTKSNKKITAPLKLYGWPQRSQNSNGFICFEWEEEDKTLLVEITPRGEARYYFETPTDEDEGVDTGRFDSIKQMLTRF